MCVYRYIHTQRMYIYIYIHTHVHTYIGDGCHPWLRVVCEAKGLRTQRKCRFLRCSLAGVAGGVMMSAWCGMVGRLNGGFWLNYNDLTPTSLEIMINKSCPDGRTIQVIYSELLYFSQFSWWFLRTTVQSLEWNDGKLLFNGTWWGAESELDGDWRRNQPV